MLGLEYSPHLCVCQYPQLVYTLVVPLIRLSFSWSAIYFPLVLQVLITSSFASTSRHHSNPQLLQSEGRCS